ncbi:hypothetical protein [Pseudomonas nitroreducens]|uniref:hypothetical protein n=1 Tax=Pseudomonas nitroreducens TaxID=46680 RepID=UPI003D28024F
MDYEQLLRKYIEHVRQSEGSDFLDRLNVSYGSDVHFSEEEVSELDRLSKECRGAVDTQLMTSEGHAEIPDKSIGPCTECGHRHLPEQPCRLPIMVRYKKIYRRQES